MVPPVKIFCDRFLLKILIKGRLVHLLLYRFSTPLPSSTKARTLVKKEKTKARTTLYSRDLHRPPTSPAPSPPPRPPAPRSPPPSQPPPSPPPRRQSNRHRPHQSRTATVVLREIYDASQLATNQVGTAAASLLVAACRAEARSISFLSSPPEASSPSPPHHPVTRLSGRSVGSTLDDHRVSLGSPPPFSLRQTLSSNGSVDPFPSSMLQPCPLLRYRFHAS